MNSHTGPSHTPFDLSTLPPQVVLQMPTTRWVPVAAVSPQQPLRRLHARREHGGGEVLVYEDGYRYRGRWHKSCRRLMTELYGCSSSGMTFDRYFRLGKWSPRDVPKNTILEALGIRDSIHVDLTGLSKGQTARRACPSVHGRWAREPQVGMTILEALGVPLVQPTKPAGIPVQPWVVVEPEVVLGIDLNKRAHEVRKLLFAGFGSRMARSGYDADDVLQEVYKGLLARNSGRGKFDPRKSSFGHYVHMVCGCVLANYHRKAMRQREMEQVGMLGMDSDSGELAHMDASLASDALPGQDMLLGGGVIGTDEAAAWGLAVQSLEQHLADEDVGELACQVMTYAAQGYSRSEIANELGEDPGRVGRALAKLRIAARSWGY